MEYGNTLWNLISKTDIKKLQTIQNTALCIATGCTQDTSTQHLPDEIKVFPMDTHFKLYATQFKPLTQTQTHSLLDFNAYSDPHRNIKATIFHDNEHISIISEPNITPEECKE